MGVLAKLAAGVLAISFLTFVALFGRLPALRRTPIAWLHRLLMVHLPNGILALDGRLSQGRVTASLGRCGTYVMYGRHPTVLIFFFLLLFVGEYLYLPGAWPRMGGLARVTGTAAVLLPYVFLYLAAFGDAGVISPATHARYMSHYPYDFSLFHPGAVCRTCNLVKPARSKHCAVCNRCVAKMDHHCIFINNCVGYRNQHWFVLLLLSTAVLTTYGGVLGLRLISENVRARRAGAGWALWKPRDLAWADYLVLWTLGIQDDVGVGSVTMLTVMTSPLVWTLLLYHVYLIYCGTTTNESMKWQDWKAEMEDGFAFKRSLPADRAKDPRFEPTWTRWPVESIQVLVRTTDGEPPPANAPQGAGEWKRVWTIGDVENLYDLGFRDNLVDVFVPDYSYRAEQVTEEERGRRSKKRKAQSVSSLVSVAT